MDWRRDRNESFEEESQLVKKKKKRKGAGEYTCRGPAKGRKEGHGTSIHAGTSRYVVLFRSCVYGIVNDILVALLLCYLR